MIEDRARDIRVHELLEKYHRTRANRIIIFVLYKKEAVRVEQFLSRKGWKVRTGCFCCSVFCCFACAVQT